MQKVGEKFGGLTELGYLCTQISENSKSVTDYKNGKTKAFGYLVGQCIRISKGKADPEAVSKILNNKLNDLEV